MKGMFQASLLVLVALIILTLLASPHSLSAAFAFSSIDFPGSILTEVTGINNSGQIVGSYNPGSHGFLLSHNSFSTIDFPSALPNSTSTRAHAINNSGQIVGVFNDLHGFLISKETYSAIDIPAANSTVPNGINDRGHIVGSYQDANSVQHSFFLSDGTVTTIDPAGAIFSTANDVNNRDDIVGSYRDLSSFGTCPVIHGYLLSKGQFSTIDFPGAVSTFASGINNRGQIVGDYEIVTSQIGECGQKTRHGFLFSNGDFQTLDIPGAYRMFLSKIDDHGRTVGTYQDRAVGGTLHGFMLFSVPREN